MDPRIKKLAKLLVHYSLGVKKKQLVKIKGEAVTSPLITAIYEEVIKAGAYPYVQVILPEAEEAALKFASDDQLKFISPINKLEVNRIDCLVVIWGTQNTSYLAGIDPKRQALKQQSAAPLMKKTFKRIADKSLTWVGTMFPTHADAQLAEMSLSDYEDFVYGAGHLHKADPIAHWKKVAREQDRLIKILNRTDKLHIRSATTDLKMRVKGRKWINCAGTENFPDGEIFTSPLESTVEGHIQFSYPANYGGRTAEGVRLEFKKGKIMNETATKGEDYLKAMLDMDRGARFVGEIAIGTNYQIKKSTGNTLFDEKIGGTCHLAAGASIPEAGGKNSSALHWDMVCDLKKGGEIETDGIVIYRNGKFLI